MLRLAPRQLRNPDPYAFSGPERAGVSALGVLVQLLVHCIVGAKKFDFLLPGQRVRA